MPDVAWVGAVPDVAWVGVGAGVTRDPIGVRAVWGKGSLKYVTDVTEIYLTLQITI